MARPPLAGWNIALLLALLAGCAVLPPPATFPNRPQQAETAARKGNHAQAAQLYEAAAAARARRASRRICCWPLRANGWPPAAASTARA
ncbi:MAG: hypothetical protein ACHQAR_00190 [Steroidobacterales bacterium]